MKPIQFDPMTDMPDAVKMACLEVIAYMVNTNKAALMIQMNDLQYEGQPLGSYEVSFQKTD